MPDLKIHLFVEDRTLESFLTELIKRVCGDFGVYPILSPMSNRGGAGKTIASFKKYQALAKNNSGLVDRPDVLIIGRDANCKGPNVARKEIIEEIDHSVFPHWALACPDPHIERWFLADAQAFESLYGVRPVLPNKKCGKDIYKKLLESTLDEAGIETLVGGYDIAPEVISEIDPFRLSKIDHAFGLFYKDLNSSIKLAL